MTDLDDKLSYLLDDHPGKNPDAELDEVIGDVNLQYCMRRYQIIGEVMRNELPRAIDTGFNSEVMARIRSQAPQQKPTTEKLVASPPVSPVLSWFSKPLAGLAVTAAVAIVTVALWQPLDQSGEVDDALVSTSQLKIEQLAEKQVPGTAVTVSTQVQPLGMRWKVERDTPALQRKLNAYLVNHTEYSNSVQGLIPQARVAGFDDQQ